VQVLEREGIPVKVFALEAQRPNVVARLAGNGSKRPLLIIGHTDVVNVDPQTQTVTLRGPERTVDLKVRDPKQFALIAKGDQVEATYAQALAVKVERVKGTAPKK